MQRCASSSATWIGQQQLWFGQREAVLLSDPDDLHEKLALAVNIRQLDPLSTAGGFLQRSAIRIAGDIGQAAIASTPTESWLDNHHECAIASTCGIRPGSRVCRRSRWCWGCWMAKPVIGSRAPSC